MSPHQQILHSLQAVAHERRLRAADPSFGARVHRVKAYQHARFSRTYADLLADPAQAAAARFFLDDLYGPQDHSQRDAQFARIAPTLARLFPAPLVATVAELAEMHALAEQFDSALGRDATSDAALNPESYRLAWQKVGDSQGRQRQIDLMLSVGRALDAHTRNPLLRHSLRMMRGPARAAGLSALQAMLERGLDTFRALPDAERFLRTVAEREADLARRLFEAPTAEPSNAQDPLAQLPPAAHP